MASSQYFHEQSHQRQQQKTISPPPPTKLAIRLEGKCDQNGHFGNKKMANGIGKLKNGAISNGHGPHLNGLYVHENGDGLGDQENVDLTIDGRGKMPGELNMP